MYFKIHTPSENKYTDMGMVEITASFYLEKGDEGYDKYVAEHYVDGNLNPFCNHSIQFEADVTDEEILWCFEFAMDQTHKNYLADDLPCKSVGKIVNQPINYLSRKAFYKGVKTIPEQQQTAYMKAELSKCIYAKSKVTELKDKDFTKVNTIEKYRVK